MAAKTPHILILPSWYPTRHSPEEGCFFREQALALFRTGARVSVVYPDLRSMRTVRRGELLHNRFQESFENDQGIPTLRWHGWNPPKLPRLRRSVWLSQAAKLVERYLVRFGRPDLVHAHSASWAGAAALAARQRYYIPYVVTEHSSWYERGLIHGWQEPQIRDVFAFAGEVLAVSRAVAKHIAPYLDGREPRILPNLVDAAFFVPPPEVRQARPFRYLTLGLLNSNKAFDVLLRAFAELDRETLDGSVLEIGGDGPERAPLQALAKRLAIADRVRFLGALSRDEVRQAMWRANGFVLASRVETFGVVLIEAMATGLPVIATRSGGPQEVVSPEVGLLTDPDDVHALTKGLAALRADYATWVRRAPNIRAYAATRFGVDAVIGDLLRIYEQALQRSRPVPTQERVLCAS